MSEKKIHKSHLSLRLNILFFLVFLLFSALILRLGVVQIVQGEEFQDQLESEVSVSQEVEAPRGLMYDRYGTLLVDNELQLTVTYTNRNRPQEQLLETAEALNEFITLDTEDAETRYERDRREFWALQYPEEFEEKLTLEEQNEQGMSDGEAHSARIEAVTDEELSALDDTDLEVFMIWREFNSGYNDVPHKVLRGADYEEAAQIMEHIEYLPGVDIIRDSSRRYVYGDSMASLFGSVGSIPRDDLERFLSQGYERNEEIGNSYLEAQYENTLRGRSGSVENFTDQDGNVIRSPEENAGSRGNDLMLTFDIELYERISNIIDEELESRPDSFYDDPDAYVVMMEPDTGEVLTLAGGQSDLGTFTQGYVVGSSIKGATVYTGFDTEVFSPGDGIYDRTITLPGSNDISSWRQLGYVDDVAALEQSSNIYMVEVAMRLIDYVHGVSGTNWGNFHNGYRILRSYYQQFGLGVETGIDLPNEFTGIDGGEPDFPGNMLFLSFGQFDTYTPLQLAQYASTIANDGVRIAPRVVSEIMEPNPQEQGLGSISHQFQPQILNVLDSDPEYIERIQRGFHEVINGSQGTARAYFNNIDETVAGKTGTAQVTVNGEDATNQTFAGYAPFEEPEIAFSVVVPGVGSRDGDSGIANTIAQRSVEAYFDLKEERAGLAEPEEEAEEDPIIDEPEEENSNE